ncbi:MAG: hypothetical protein HGA95_00860, partial [Caldiserica bacterium]|nr:hypothetical protein [Caldisericota bacterium]
MSYEPKYNLPFDVAAAEQIGYPLIIRAAYALGGILRNYFDLPVVNGFGDAMGE